MAQDVGRCWLLLEEGCPEIQKVELFRGTCLSHQQNPYKHSLGSQFCQQQVSFRGYSLSRFPEDSDWHPSKACFINPEAAFIFKL